MSPLNKYIALTKCFILSLIISSISLLLFMFCSAKIIQLLNILLPTEYIVYFLGFSSISFLLLFFSLFLFFVKRKYKELIKEAKFLIGLLIFVYVGFFIYNAIEVFKTNHITF